MVNGNPAFRVDLPARRFFLFGNIFTASDTIFLLLVLWFLAFSLFFFTAVFGRIWCGYACPQTVFLESWIRPLELWIDPVKNIEVFKIKEAVERVHGACSLTGMTPIRYLTSRRMHLAAEMLRESDLPPDEIAERTGCG